MRIGLTGASGLIGRALLRHLELIHEPQSISAFPGDILDSSGVADWASEFSPSLVFHLAAKVPSRVADSEKRQVRELNGGGPGQFACAVAAAIHPKKVKIVYVSTSHVYSSSPSPIPESGLVDPITFYGQTKLEGEEGLRALEKNGVIRLTVIRLFSVFSKEQSREYLYGSLREKIQIGREQTISLPGWNNIRDFLPADEAAAKIGQLGLTDFDGTVNLGSGRGLSLKSFAEENFHVKLLTAEADEDPAPTSLVANISLMNSLLSVPNALY